MKIILIGFMGSGKSAVAKTLAKKLSAQAIDMDELVLKLSKRKSISEIFEKDGEISFRELEIKIAKKLTKTKNAVIATGGGVVMNKIIIDYLRSNSKIIYLKTSFHAISQRLSQSTDRPLFKDLKKAEELYNQRLPFYNYHADITIITNNKSLEKVTDKILKELKR